VDGIASVRAAMGSKGRGKRSVPKLQREPPALEVQRGHKAAEAQHLAVARDKKNAQRAAVQDMVAVEAAREAAARARGDVAAAACVASVGRTEGPNGVQGRRGVAQAVKCGGQKEGGSGRRRSSSGGRGGCEGSSGGGGEDNQRGTA